MSSTASGAGVRRAQSTKQSGSSANRATSSTQAAREVAADRDEKPHRSRSHRTRNPPAEMAPTVANTAGPAVVDSRAAAVSRSAGRPSRSRTMIPTASGSWELGKTIGAGSMGKVKIATLASDPTQRAACKIIPRISPEDGHHTVAERERADQSKEIRTAREAAIVTLLDHPYICGLRDVVRTNYHWYMLFEYVNGGQMLDYIISHGKLKEKQARKFSRQIASALDYCHRNSIVHRDLKIENILISKNGDIKIIDFGLSNLFSPRASLKTFCGSLYFAAPELLQARAYTGPEVDIWSFGIVLYVLVCGKVPFDDQSMPALHAKIKKGLVDYPSWLSTECKSLLSRMLVTDPRQRASMYEVLTHPWMNKGYPGPPENYVPLRDPLTLPLDQDVITAMTGFNFGPPEVIKTQLMRTIESEEYQRTVRMFQREKETAQPPKDAEKKRGFGFDFYKRRNSMNSRDTLTTPSAEGLQLGSDPVNAYDPYISIYYLVREKQERDRAGLAAAHPAPPTKEKEPVPEIVPPKAAHTNTSAYEMPGEKVTGGRTRPRARTHGEDDAPEQAKQPQRSPKALQKPEPSLEAPAKKESAAAGIFRRLSRRERREPPPTEKTEKDRSHPPQVHVHSPAESPGPSVLRKSFSIRRTRRDRDDAPRLRSGSSQPQHSDLLSPPMSAGGTSKGHAKGLGRSTSVSSAEFARRRVADGAAPEPRETRDKRDTREPPPTSGSDQSATNVRATSNRKALNSKTVAYRAKSLGHARRESIQARRLMREQEASREANVPEETDAEVGDQSGMSNDRLENPELAKPVFLKGLFSVSTTSTRPVPEIRADIKRVLKLLGVEYTEIKGGFNCRHAPSIDMNKVNSELPQTPGAAPPLPTPGHRRRFSFGGLRGASDRDREDEKPPGTPRTPGNGKAPAGLRHDDSDSRSDISEADPTSRETGQERRLPPGETSTHVQNDLGDNLVLEFEIFIVKVPMISLYGVQFKRLEGNTWQYKSMADQILKELRL